MTKRFHEVVPSQPLARSHSIKTLLAISHSTKTLDKDQVPFQFSKIVEYFYIRAFRV
jgi:hypothetical protein